jgi:predicted nucleic acid-binding Zn ribbon protein
MVTSCIYECGPSFKKEDLMADFIDKITGSIDKGIRAVSSKGKELYETTKLRGQIKDVEDTIQNRFNGMGKKVYGMLTKGSLNEEELKADYGEITDLYKKITELEENIKQVELESLQTRQGVDVFICPKCSAPNKSGDRFCSDCGSALPAEVVTEGKNCPTCGSSIKEGAKFCTRCGGKLG